MLAVGKVRTKLSSSRLAGCLLMALALPVYCAEPAESQTSDESAEARRLLKLSLEDLNNTEISVSVASRSPERLMDTPAAVSVLTQEDIRRSGATCIPEVLRLVPGLIVARIGSNQWAISSRFSNSRFSNKLLVLMDGRILYTPLFAGTFWDVQDTIMEDIERIEVIRGPGASIWGSNAVCGVINIITKNAHATLGNMAVVGSGTKDHLIGELRFGEKYSDTGAFNVWGKRTSRGSFSYITGADAQDDWTMSRAGYRLDDDVTPKDHLTLLGSFYGGQEDALVLVPPLVFPFTAVDSRTISPTGQNALGRWTHRDSPLKDWSLQVFYDRTTRNEIFLGEMRQTYDFDFIHRNATPRGDEFLWGLGYRYTTDALQRIGDLAAFDPPSQNNYLASAFFQQHWMLPEKHLQFWVGSKIEVNSYTNLEIEPTIRAAWNPTKKSTVWGALSRGVRIPSRQETSLSLDVATVPPGLFPDFPQGAELIAFGNRNLVAERLVSYELGYRVNPNRSTSVDLAVYHEDFADLVNTTQGTPFFDLTRTPPLVIPFNTVNNGTGYINGLELSTTYEPSLRWKLVLNYTALFSHYYVPTGTDTSREDRSPRNQAHLRSYYNLRKNLDLDALFYYTESVRAVQAPSYLRGDLRLGWRPKERLQVDLVGQNLFNGGHSEFRPQIFSPTVNVVVPRTLYGKVTWLF